jgi:hypothetical protein
VDGGPGVHRPDTPPAPPPTGPLTSAVASMVRAGSASHRQPTVVGGHEQSRAVCEDPRSSVIYGEDLGMKHA